MPNTTPAFSLVHLLLTCCLPAVCCFGPQRAVDAADSHVIVPGYERFRSEHLTDVAAGKLLISELNCQSCHGKLLDEGLPQRQAPILTKVANRVLYEHLKSFIADPQEVKAGTAMPQVLTGENSREAAEAIAQFLASGGSTVPGPVSSAAIQRGEKLFHSVGCAACHGDRTKVAEDSAPFAMPLGNLTQKYTLGSLIGFLKDPHAARPSGRMPALNLNDDEARDVASYLLQGVEVEPNMTVEYFEGSWDSLPDFESLDPKSVDPATDFDVALAPRKNNFALRFTAFLHVPHDGEYQFWLGSDDGSRLLIDGEEIVNADGIHPHSVKDGKQKLSSGPHRVVVEYFEQGGEESLSVEIGGPDIARQPLAGMVSNTDEPPAEKQRLALDQALVARGRELFASSGCVQCHQHDDVKPVAESEATAPQLAAMNLQGGCLSADAVNGVPRFSLTPGQRSDIVAALTELKSSPDNVADQENHIGEIMLTLNCYACHQREKIGGVPRIHDHLFTGSIPEMGDEGRVPPHLDGVGDKLQESWLKEVMQKGAKDRPYMATRMPKFGERNIGKLIELLASNDQKTVVKDVEFQDPPHRVTADARFMVGDQALSCIKCHYFDKHKATGIQSLDLTTMTRRLRRDWFHRYLLNPQAYRPGTRMPSAWPNNRSVVPKILHGDPNQQIEAIWLYLSDGKEAKIPSGLVAKAIELKPTDRPVIYRNFIEGLSPRGIAVGYPEGAHIAWDAEQMTLRLIWHGAFIDASKHWVGRGPGFQTPLGDHVMTLPSGPPLAVLDDSGAKWPGASARDAGFRFSGYVLDKSGRPTFKYRWNDIAVSDSITATAAEPDALLTRSLEFQSPSAAANVFLRLASADTVSREDDGWLIDGGILLKFAADIGQVRSVDGKQELLIPLTLDNDGRASVSYQIVW